MNYFIQKHKRKISLKATIIGLIILVVLILSGIVSLLLGDENNDYLAKLNIALEFEIKIPEKYNEPLVVSALKHSLSVEPVDAKSVQAVKEADNIIRYIEAYPNTDVEQKRYPNKLKESLILKEPGHPLEFVYKLGDLSNFEVEKDTSGNLNFYPSGKKDELYKLFVIPAPFMIDAENKKSPFSAVITELDEIKGILILRPSQDWLSEAVYPVILDPTIEIKVLNIKSHPQQGETWLVNFTTVGKADLKIIPNDQATIDDDEFLFLKCGQQVREPEILANDVIFYPDWQCDQVAQLAHYTKVAGKHTLRFEFNLFSSSADKTDSETDEDSNGAVDFAFNDSWWNDNWLNRRKITFDNSDQESDLTDFPVTVFLNSTSSRIDYSKTQDSGEDIRFVDADNSTVLDYEIEEWDETGTSTIWVEVPQIDATSSTDFIYMYYNNISADDGQNATGTWDENFVAVYHMNEDNGYTHYDSTANGFDQTAFVGYVNSVDAKIASGSYFYYNTAFQSNANADSAPKASGTVEVWVKRGWADDLETEKGIIWVGDSGSNNYYIIETETDYGEPYHWGFVHNANWWNRADFSYNYCQQGVWCLQTMTWGSGEGVKAYVDSVLRGQDSAGTISATFDTWLIGQRINEYTSRIVGVLDEVRFSNTRRTTDWIDAQYKSMTDDFASYGEEETAKPTISSVNDSPDPVSAGDVITFFVDWDTAAGVKMLVCKTNSISTSTPSCPGGEWCSNKNDYETNDPIICDYTAQSGDVGSSKTFYVFACNCLAICSDGYGGSFDVHATGTEPFRLKDGTLRLKGGTLRIK